MTNLPRRIYLTYRYHGLGSVLGRAVTFPLRFTPLARFIYVDSQSRLRLAQARSWYRRHGYPVTVVIPSYRDGESVTRLVRSIRRTTPRGRVRIIVSDDASGPDHLAALRRIRGIEIVEGKVNLGFAGNVNRGLKAAGRSTDVVILNSDMIARRGWLAALQFATSRDRRVGVVGGKLLYSDGRIQFAGTVRNLGAREWFDHRFRFKPSSWGPANVPQPVLAVTGACMYVKRAVLDQVGLFDEAYPMAYEDVDYCLRVWQAGYRVLYWPDAELTHLESVTRGTAMGERERASQRIFWERWGEFFDGRRVHNPNGALRVIYVTQDTGLGGGHRVVFEHANRLQDRGLNVELWSLTGPPEWFDLRVPVKTFRDYGHLIEALKPLEAIKVATWWETAAPVWESSVLHGIPVYFVQDIETSYYPGSESARHHVLASYRHEFRYLTTSSWNADHLRELGLEPVVVAPGIDLERFHPRPELQRSENLLVALGRSNPLKNLPLTLEAWQALPEPRPELCLFGIEPDLAPADPRARYVTGPSDDEVNQLLNQATAFVQTSVHEGFCLPVLEAMAAACPVVCTNAHGNLDYCEDGQNCLMPEPEPVAVAAAVRRVLTDSSLRERLRAAGGITAAQYSWPKQIEALERFMNDVSRPEPLNPSWLVATGAAVSGDGQNHELPALVSSSAAILAERIAALDWTLFDAIETQTSLADRQSLLALHQAARRNAFGYLEIGSHLGGSLQVLIQDARCHYILSIDSRPSAQPDERGEEFFYPENRTDRMRALLAELPGAQLDKLTTVEASSETLRPEQIEVAPRYCFIDAEHTDQAVLRDARFCAQVLDLDGCIAFHDAGIVYRGVQRFLDELTQEDVEHRVYFLPDTILVVEFGRSRLLDTPQVLQQVLSNWQGYLWTLHENDRYRELARQHGLVG